MQAHLSTSVSPLPVRGDGTPLRPAAAYLRESDKGQGVHSFDTQLEGATAVLERHGYYVAMVERDVRKGQHRDPRWLPAHPGCGAARPHPRRRAHVLALEIDDHLALHWVHHRAIRETDAAPDSRVGRDESLSVTHI